MGIGAALRASHFGPVIGVTTAATGYAIAIDRGPRGTVFVALAVCAGQLTIGWHNDYLDADRDELAGRSDKPIATREIARRTIGRLAIVGSVATVVFSLESGWRAGLIHLVAVVSALAYNARLKATVWSFVPFALSFALLPCFVTLGAMRSAFPPWWAPSAAGLLGVGAHLLNALPDRVTDLESGIRGLPHRVSRTTGVLTAATLLWAASLILGLAPGLNGPVAIGGLLVASGLIVGVVLIARRPSSRRPFELTLVIALCDVAMLIVQGHHAI